MTAVIAVIAVIAVLHVSRDIGVYFYDLKVSAVVVSTWREWRHRINPYILTRDDRRLVMGTSKHSQGDEVFEQFEKLKHPAREEKDKGKEEKCAPGTMSDLRGQGSKEDTLFVQYAPLSNGEISGQYTKLAEGAGEDFEQFARVRGPEAKDHRNPGTEYDLRESLMRNIFGKAAGDRGCHVFRTVELGVIAVAAAAAGATIVAIRSWVRSGRCLHRALKRFLRATWSVGNRRHVAEKFLGRCDEHTSTTEYIQEILALSEAQLLRRCLQYM